MQHVLCTGNLVSKEQYDNLKKLAPNVHIVRGDFDEVSYSQPPARVLPCLALFCPFPCLVLPCLCLCMFCLAFSCLCFCLVWPCLALPYDRLVILVFCLDLCLSSYRMYAIFMQGNQFPETKVITIGQFKIGLIHGHQVSLAFAFVLPCLAVLYLWPCLALRCDLLPVAPLSTRVFFCLCLCSSLSLFDSLSFALSVFSFVCLYLFTFVCAFSLFLSLSLYLCLVSCLYLSRSLPFSFVCNRFLALDASFLLSCLADRPMGRSR